jgi:hypothetical protein
MWIIEQNSTGYLPMGPFISTASVPLTTLAGTLAPVVFKHNSASVARSSTVAIVHDGGGMYRVPFNASDSNTVGKGRVYSFSTADTWFPVTEDFQVVDPPIYEQDWGASSTRGAAIATSVLTLANIIEGEFSLQQAIEIIGAAAAGESSGFNSTIVNFTAMTSSGSTAVRITANVDPFGNRSSVVITAST